MRNLLKSLAMLFPPLRQLHEERNRYASEVDVLSKRLAGSEDAYIFVQNERDSLQSEKKELLTEIEKFSQLAFKKLTQRLHVVGYARSGTTILMDILNSSKDVFLFSELNLHVLRKFPNIFSGYGGDGFVEHFAQRKRKELPIIYKGALPPSTNLDFLTPDQYVDAVGQNYRYVGDKIATAYRSMDGVSDIELLQDFLKQEDERGALIILTLRRPSENLLSVSKMFPDADLRQWGKSIAETTITLLESFLRGNQSFLVFHEDIGPSLISELSELLGINFSLSAELVGGAHQTTKGARLSLNEPWLYALDEAYSDLYKLYGCDDSAIKHSKTDGLIKKLALVVARLKVVASNFPAQDDSIVSNQNSFIFQYASRGLLHEMKVPYFFDGSRQLFVPGENPDLPKAFIISLPKAGTYLASAYLESLGYVNTGVHLSQNTLTDYRGKSIDEMIFDHKNLNINIPLEESLAMIGYGQYAVGHLPYSKDNLSAIKDFRCIFLIRDLRVALISLLRWFLKRKKISPDSSIAIEDDSKKQFLDFLNFEARNHFAWYESMLGWKDSGCKIVRFEDVLSDERIMRQRLASEIAEYFDIALTPEAALNMLNSVSGQPTKTRSGALSDVSLYWSDEAEISFKELGWFRLNKEFGYE